MKMTVITSCTGAKARTHPRKLTRADFQQGALHVGFREIDLAEVCLPAEKMYTGQHHLRLMQGVETARRNGIEVDVKILSAGYWLVRGGQVIAPYEVTFNTMSAKEASVWARQLRIRESIQAVMSEEADMVLILLGDRYLKAANLGSIAFTNTPAWAISGKVSLGELPKFINPILIKQADTTRYRAGMLALKGAVAQTILERAHTGLKRAIELVRST